jgi:hypothetical protein
MRYTFRANARQLLATRVIRLKYCAISGLSIVSQTPISHQRADESRPAGLMRGAKALSGIAMKILVEEQ